MFPGSAGEHRRRLAQVDAKQRFQNGRVGAIPRLANPSHCFLSINHQAHINAERDIPRWRMPQLPLLLDRQKDKEASLRDRNFEAYGAE
ncbi:hypothetical protein D3C72_2091600 [compost metagenome]